MTRLGAVLGVLLYASSGAAADDAAPAGDFAYTVPASSPAPDPGGLVVRLVVLTAGLVVLCGGVAWMARKSNRPPMPAGDGGGRLLYEGVLPLDRRCALHLIRVDGQAVALTTGATGLQSMVVLTEPFEAVLQKGGAVES